MQRYKALLVVVLVFSFLTACQSPADNPQDIKSISFSELYPGDFSIVDKLTIKSGRTGELKTLTDHEKISKWLDFMQDVQFIPDPDQESRVGWIYWVSFYEGEEKVFEFFPNRVGDVYYLVDEKVSTSIEELFNTKQD